LHAADPSLPVLELKPEVSQLLANGISNGSVAMRDIEVED
jgi:hypothetical protein